MKVFHVGPSIVGVKNKYMTVFGQKIHNYKLFSNFAIRNLCLDPDPDRDRILQQNGYGFSEYGSEH
jgi:hypothetical protein